MKKLLILIFFTPIVVFGQYNLTLYHLNKTVPQANFLNPGLMPNGQINIGFPGASNIHFGVSNSFSARDILKEENDKLVFQLDELSGNMSDQNYFHQTFRVDPLYIGFWAQKNYFSFHLAARESFTFGYPKTLAEYIIQGNGGANLGKSIPFDDIVFKTTGWMEFGVGFGRSMMNNKLTLGIRAKYLYGGYHAAIANGISGSLTTDPETYAITLAIDELQLNTAGLTAADIYLFENDDYPEDQDSDDEELENYLRNNKNRGLAIDIGGSYQVTPKLKLHASIIDLGSIKWQTAVKSYSLTNSSYTFEGIDIKNADDFADALTDTLDAIFDPVITEKAYKESLSSKYYLGANIKIGKKHTIGAMNYGEFIKGKFRSALNIHYNLQLGRTLNTVISYNAMNGGFNNLGAGLSLNMGFWQLYAASDNILSYIHTSKAKNIDLRFGMNLTFGRKRHERIMQGLPGNKKRSLQIDSDE